MIRENLNPNVDIEGILPTLVDSRTIHAKEAIEILEENFGDRVFASRIRKTVRFAEAPVKGMSVLRVRARTASPRRPTGIWRKEVLHGAGISGRACARARLRRCFARPRRTRGAAPASRGRAAQAPEAAAEAPRPRCAGARRRRSRRAARAARERAGDRACPRRRSGCAPRSAPSSPRTCSNASRAPAIVPRGRLRAR